MGMKVGDRVKMRPETFGNDADRPDVHNHTSKALWSAAPPIPGTVTYCHPSGRWYQVTFDNGIKECFFVDVEPTPLAQDRGRHHGAFWREIK